MLYHENRINPLKSVALYWHINKCTDCKELFLAMDQAGEIDSEIETASIIPEGFNEAVMAKISAIPMSERPVSSSRLKASQPAVYKNSTEWMRLAGCVYALLLAAGLGILYNIQLPYSSLSVWEQVNAALNNFFQAGQYAASNTATVAGGYGSPVLAIAVVLGLALLYMLQREKTFGKKT